MSLKPAQCTIFTREAPFCNNWWVWFLSPVQFPRNAWISQSASKTEHHHVQFSNTMHLFVSKSIYNRWVGFLSSVCLCMVNVCTQFIDIGIEKFPHISPITHTAPFFATISECDFFCHQSKLCATPNLCGGRTGFLDKLEGNRAAGAKVVRTIKSLPPRQLPYKMPLIASHSRLMTCSQATIGPNQVCHQGNILLTVFLLRWKTFHRPGRVSLGLKT